MKKHKVTRLEKTCPACPSQWEGRTKKGEHVYIRFRWGVIEIGIGKTLDKAIDKTVNKKGVSLRMSHYLDGFMSTKRMKKKLKHHLKFSKRCGSD